MGKEIFNLPTAVEIELEAAVTEQEEDGDYCTMTSTLRTTSSSGPCSSQSEDLTVDSPVHLQSNTE